MKKDIDFITKHEAARAEREKHVAIILESKSKKKIVVAGPGTGKTFLFKRVLEKKEKALALTFINALVEDLCLELGGLADVKTLHGYALKILKGVDKDIKIFPKLSDIIKEDASILIGKQVDFKEIFHNMDGENEHVDFYRKRKDYYGKYYGYSDVVFAAVKYFEKNKKKIPEHDQIVVDEYQDFNALEVSFIEKLAERNPILIVGDDDQAIYDFKHADPKYIRLKHGDEQMEYERFDLPFCSRCTRVIVEAVNDIIDSASKNGFLKNRVLKPYKYFCNQEKDAEGTKNPKILWSQQYANKMPWFIEKQITNTAQDLKRRFSVLIICPTRAQCKQMAKALELKKGFDNIEYSDKQSDKEATLLDGLKLLLKNNKCNLGWRIVSKFLEKDEDFKSLLKKTDEDKPRSLHEIVSSECKTQKEKIIKVLKTCKNDGSIDESSIEILKTMDFNPFEIVKEILKQELDFDSRRKGNPGIRNLPIKITTIQGSKGLSGDCVFITYFDDQYFIQNKDKKKISDKDICNFLVTLTRARKKVYLVSSRIEEPVFLKWINKERIEKI